MAFDVIINGEDGLVVRDKLNGNFTNAVETTDPRLGSVGYPDLATASALTRAELLAVSQAGTGKKTTVGDVLGASGYGGIFATGNAVAEGTVGLFPAINIVQAWTSNDVSSRITPSHVAGTLIVPEGEGGTYRIVSNVYAYVGSNSKRYGFGIFVNSGLFATRVAYQVTSAAGAGGNLTVSSNVALLAGDVITLGVFSTDGGTAMTISDADLFMQRIGA
jgi:hypothetical protein